MFDCAPPLESITPLRHQLPLNACDSHCHIFGPAAVFPFVADRPYTPPDAPFEKLHARHQELGLSRTVLIQAACHGSNMSAVLDGIERGKGQYRGVALLEPDVTPEQVRDLDARGIRGVRFNFLPHLNSMPDWVDVERIVKVIAPYSWHICAHTDKTSLVSLLPMLQRLNIPFVMDHMGRVSADEGIDSDAFQALLSLKKNANAWVKISGIDRISSSGKRPFSDGQPFISALAESMPDRLLWGTDWPHPNVRGDMPDDGELVNIFTRLCPDPALQEQILVTNPQALYRFDDANI